MPRRYTIDDKRRTKNPDLGYIIWDTQHQPPRPVCEVGAYAETVLAALDGADVVAAARYFAGCQQRYQKHRTVERLSELQEARAALIVAVDAL
ncbi:hypothetical protein [Hyphobacterium sp.]|uniref:hypothetical protein n=1 Tax=Hyphobacterium sp. TaxID=2004662 RepID=UPI003B51CCCD